jgi:hypothetical protein
VSRRRGRLDTEKEGNEEGEAGRQVEELLVGNAMEKRGDRWSGLISGPRTVAQKLSAFRAPFPINLFTSRCGGCTHAHP